MKTEARSANGNRVPFFGSIPTILWLILALLAPYSASADLIFTAPPRESRADAERLYGPVANLLSRVLGEPVVYQHPRSWLHYQRDMRNDRFDIVFDDPHFISWRMSKYGHRPVAKLPGRLGYYVITWQDNESVQELQDLVNRRVCVVAPPNLSALVLLGEFHDPIRQPRLVTAVHGGMKRAYKAFQSGRCDAVVLRDQFVETEIIEADKQELKILSRTQLYTNQGFTIRGTFDDETFARLQETLTRPQPELMPLLKRFAPNADGMLPADMEDYQDYYHLLSDHIVGWEMY